MQVIALAYISDNISAREKFIKLKGFMSGFSPADFRQSLTIV
jgi:hypothetical protein